MPFPTQTTPHPKPADVSRAIQPFDVLHGRPVFRAPPLVVPVHIASEIPFTALRPTDAGPKRH